MRNLGLYHDTPKTAMNSLFQCRDSLIMLEVVDLYREKYLGFVPTLDFVRSNTIRDFYKSLSIKKSKKAPLLSLDNRGAFNVPARETILVHIAHAAAHTTHAARHSAACRSLCLWNIGNHDLGG